MLAIDHKKRITIVKGDTAIFNITMNNYEFVEGDKLYFTVKKNVGDTESVIQKIISTFNGRKAKIFLSKEDTDIDMGTYLYDVQCVLFDGVVDTVIPPTKFEVLGGVTHD